MRKAGLHFCIQNKVLIVANTLVMNLTGSPN
jgi:hypothetical protein